MRRKKAQTKPKALIECETFKRKSGSLSIHCRTFNGHTKAVDFTFIEVADGVRYCQKEKQRIKKNQ